MRIRGHYVRSETVGASCILGTTLIQIDNEWLDFALAPLNSPAGLLGMVLLALHYVYRRLIH